MQLLMEISQGVDLVNTSFILCLFPRWVALLLLASVIPYSVTGPPVWLTPLGEKQCLEVEELQAVGGGIMDSQPLRKKHKRDWEKTFAYNISGKGFVFKIYKELLQLPNKKITPLKNGLKICIDIRHTCTDYLHHLSLWKFK